MSAAGWRLTATTAFEFGKTRTHDRYDSSFVTAGPSIRLGGERRLGSRSTLRSAVVGSYNAVGSYSCLTSLPPQSCRFGSHSVNALTTASARFWIVEPEIGAGWGLIYRAGKDPGVVANGLTANAAITFASSPLTARRFFLQIREAHWLLEGPDRRRTGLSLGMEWRR